MYSLTVQNTGSHGKSAEDSGSGTVSDSPRSLRGLLLAAQRVSRNVLRNMWMVLRNGSSGAYVNSAPHSVVSQRDRVMGLKVDSVTVSRADVPVSA